jgi:hypothetical protein
MSSSTVPSTSSAPRTRRPAGEVVLGVDTHQGVHVAAVLSALGAVLATDEFPVTAAGYRDLLKRARKWGTGGEPEWRGPAHTERLCPAICWLRAWSCLT